MQNFFLIHGTGGTPDEIWLPWLRAQLVEEHGSEYVWAPPFPDMAHQNYKNWEAVLKGYLTAGLIDANSVFICHSIACIFIVKFLIKHKLKAKKLIFVSGFNNVLFPEHPEIEAVVSSFYIKNVKPLSLLCTDVNCIYSNNDPYLKLANLQSFAKSLNAKELFFKERGHFNGAVGCFAMPEILELLK